MNGMTPLHSLRAADIRVTNAARKKVKAIHEPAGALLIDEFSQLQARMLHANNLFWSVARHSKYNLDLQDYALPRETAGRVSKYVLSGDHLQLPPVPASQSLLAPIDGTSDEHKAGTAMFAGIENVFLMETMMRFTDPILRSILEKMRTPGGARLTDAEWHSLKATAIDADTLDDATSRSQFCKRIEG